MNKERIYIGPYKVIRVSTRVEVIERNLTREEAKGLVNTFPNSNASMVVFTYQYSSERYYREVEKVLNKSATKLIN